MNNRNAAFFLATVAAFIYGITFTIAKEVMPLHIKPFGFIFLRVSGAAVLFWISSLLITPEKIEFKDYKKILLASVFGVALNMLSFFKGLSLTTPINGAAIMITSPVLVMLFSIVLLKEPTNIRKILGVFLGLSGAVLLIAYGQHPEVNAPNIQIGNFLVFVNAASYSVYLIIAKPLLHKYHPVHFAKWMYLFGFLWVIPFGWEQVQAVTWAVLPYSVYWRIAFVVVCTTFLTYLFNLLALQKIKPTTLSVFIYLQPLVASMYAVWMGSDQLSFVKVVATFFIFLGVYLVSVKKTVDNE